MVVTKNCNGKTLKIRLTTEKEMILKAMRLVIFRKHGTMKEQMAAISLYHKCKKEL